MGAPTRGAITSSEKFYLIARGIKDIPNQPCGRLFLYLCCPRPWRGCRENQHTATRSLKASARGGERGPLFACPSGRRYSHHT
jgi:hypothetical protein